MRTTLLALAVLCVSTSALAAEPRDPFSAFPDTVVCCFGPTPLEQVPLEAIKVQGIVADTASPRALVQHPDGKTYLVRVGDPLGQHLGRVAAIKRDGVLVVEAFRDPITTKTIPQRTLLAVR